MEALSDSRVNGDQFQSETLPEVPVRTMDGDAILGSQVVVDDNEGAVLLDFKPGADAIPVFSLADLHACSETKSLGFFHRNFSEKVVIFGSVLDAEDRLLTSKRFITGPESDRNASRCVHSPMGELYLEQVSRDLIPGVIVQATAVENILRGGGLSVISPRTRAALYAGLSALSAIAFIVFPLGLATTALFVGIGGIGLGAAWALTMQIAAPGLSLMFALVLASTIGGVFRYLTTNREKRLLRSSFSLYLSPKLIDELIDSGKKPKLGGETRRASILVSDLAGFTSLSERAEPEKLITCLNEYLGVVADVIERQGGVVDKFMGDGVLAVFGAPVSQPEHASQAVAAAREILEAASQLSGLSELAGRPVDTRIGIATGRVLVGNVGSARRLNYTVIGDAVNLAARLEPENKVRGTSILLDEETARMAGVENFRHVATISVRGREAIANIFTVK